ncbi:MAG: 30S ribosomal protein S12 methylthiotransferase RimO [Desulfobacterales bacterium]|nr:30S ribosomal protein S12 methylthiotransferase RimO [Desulfobacterales bacterium]MDD4073390.1 30S ribosomal protein S12 methylthiotransferase RimO [Desulfobacterales bacterium]MDD4394116.1 30S ribosomal protein S12 methylthiotransferase RimO [Desulfobacterales bacterium]
MKLYLISLGCARNLIDSDIMLSRLMIPGWIVTEKPEEADVILVNTCGFIEAAADESIRTILEMARFKIDGVCRTLVVAGCLPERFGEQIAAELPEVDIFLGTGAYDKICEILTSPPAGSHCVLPDPNSIGFQPVGSTRTLTPSHMAYLKIAEGCSKHCTYCIIPRLRGRHRSRPLKDIVSEARLLVSEGARELILVAQDTTAYGQELAGEGGLECVLEALSGISDHLWIRFLYGHPASITDLVVRTVARHSNICSYFDIPVQHAADRILKQMGRPCTADDLYRLYDSIRTVVPDAALRTTVMVGFPGETDADFKELLRFIETVRFDQLGGFIYSDFDDLSSHTLSGHVPEHVAKERFDELMKRQRDIAMQINQQHVEKVLDVLVEENPEQHLFVGRTSFQAPEVDGVTYIHGENLQVGDFVKIRITDAYEYDLSGEAL